MRLLIEDHYKKKHPRIYDSTFTGTGVQDRTLAGFLGSVADPVIFWI